MRASWLIIPQFVDSALRTAAGEGDPLVPGPYERFLAGRRDPRAGQEVLEVPLPPDRRPASRITPC